jgi:hypothetical protein
MVRGVEPTDRDEERGSVLPHPPGPSLAATTSDVRPRLTFFVSCSSMTAQGYKGLPGFQAESMGSSTNAAENPLMSFTRRSDAIHDVDPSAWPSFGTSARKSC